MKKIFLIFTVSISLSLKAETKIANILDMHVHAAGIGIQSECFVSDLIKESVKFKIYMNAFNTSLKEVEKFGDQIIIEKISKEIKRSFYVSNAIILAMDGVIDSNGELDRAKTQMYVPNSFVEREVKKYENLYFGASINPYRKNALELLERESENGAMLVKWIPSIQMINPADKKIIPFYKLMVKLNIPLLTHVGQERSFKHAKDEFCDPRRLALPLSLGVRVIAAHVGTTGIYDKIESHKLLLPMFEKYKNLYADISSLTQINKRGFLKEILKVKNIQSRLLFGTDFPLINTLLVSPIYFIFDLGISDTLKLLNVKNSFDSNVLLMRKLGISDQVFVNTWEFFKKNTKLKF